MLAHIRYRCASDGPGRLQREGHRWWRVSHQDLGEEVGLSRKAVMAALKALGELVPAKHFPPLANQARAYRVAADGNALTSQSPKTDSADQPVSRSGQPESENGHCRVPNGTDPCPDSDSALPIENLEKEGEAAGSRRLAANPAVSPQSANGKAVNWIRGPYGPRCPDPEHNVPDPPACPGCRDARLAAKAVDDREEAVQKQERAERAALLKNCPDCQGIQSWITDDDGEPIKKCDHRRTA